MLGAIKMPPIYDDPGNEVTFKMSCHKLPWLALANSRLWLPSWKGSQSMSYFCFSLSFCPSTCHSFITFTSNCCYLIMYPMYNSLRFGVIFASRESSGLVWSRIHLMVFLAVYGTYKALLNLVIWYSYCFL